MAMMAIPKALKKPIQLKSVFCRNKDITYELTKNKTRKARRARETANKSRSLTLS